MLNLKLQHSNNYFFLFSLFLTPWDPPHAFEELWGGGNAHFAEGAATATNLPPIPSSSIPLLCPFPFSAPFLGLFFSNQTWCMQRSVSIYAKWFVMRLTLESAQPKSHAFFSYSEDSLREWVYRYKEIKLKYNAFNNIIYLLYNSKYITFDCAVFIAMSHCLVGSRVGWHMKCSSVWVPHRMVVARMVVHGGAVRVSGAVSVSDICAGGADVA